MGSMMPTVGGQYVNYHAKRIGFNQLTDTQISLGVRICPEILPEIHQLSHGVALRLGLASRMHFGRVPRRDADPGAHRVEQPGILI